MTNFDEYPRPMTNFFLAIAAYQLPRYKSLMPPRQSLDYPFGGWENGVEEERKEESHNALHHTPTKSTGPQTTPTWKCPLQGRRGEGDEASKSQRRKHITEEQSERASERESRGTCSYLLPTYIFPHTHNTHTHTHTLGPFFLLRILELPADNGREGGRTGDVPQTMMMMKRATQMGRVPRRRGGRTGLGNMKGEGRVVVNGRDLMT